MKQIGLIIIICGFSLISSCVQDKNNSIEKKSDTTTNTIDTLKVIEHGVDYIFKTQRFAIDYYINPLKIVKSKNVPANITFFLNGLKIELVNEKPNLNTEDWRHPYPYLEVLKLKNTEKDRVLLTLLFRTTGNEYTIWLKKEKSNNLKIDSLSHLQI